MKEQQKDDSGDIEDLFKESYTTIFCSHNKDRTIHAAPIWYNYRDDVFYFISIKKQGGIKGQTQQKCVPNIPHAGSLI